MHKKQTKFKKKMFKLYGYGEDSNDCKKKGVGFGGFHFS